jgi:hypothetical protein
MMIDGIEQKLDDNGNTVEVRAFAGFLRCLLRGSEPPNPIQPP